MEVSHSYEEQIRKATLATKIYIRLILTLFLVFMSILAYWVLEPEPLVVLRPDDEAILSVCRMNELGEKTFSFKRYVYSSKALNIYVQERYQPLDGSLDYLNNSNLERNSVISGEIVYPDTLHYPLDEGFEKVMSFPKRVPIELTDGDWLYKPYATYKVNPFKTVTVPLPVQRVRINCSDAEFDHEANKLLKFNPR